MGSSFSSFAHPSAAISTDHDDEVEEVRWVPIDRAQRACSAHDAEREIVAQAIDYLDSDL